MRTFHLPPFDWNWVRNSAGWIMSGWEAFVGSAQGNSLALPVQGFEESNLYGKDKDSTEVSIVVLSRLSAGHRYSRAAIRLEIELTSTCAD